MQASFSVVSFAMLPGGAILAAQTGFRSDPAQTANARHQSGRARHRPATSHDRANRVRGRFVHGRVTNMAATAGTIIVLRLRVLLLAQMFSASCSWAAGIIGTSLVSPVTRREGSEKSRT
jgi:hypothetical protein